MKARLLKSIVVGGLIAAAAVAGYRFWNQRRFDSTLAEALASIRRGDVETARDRLEPLVESDPERRDGEAAYWLGTCEWKLNRQDRAAIAFEHVSRNSNYWFKSIRRLVEYDLETGRYRRAEDRIDEARGVANARRDAKAGAELREIAIELLRKEARYDDVKTILLDNIRLRDHEINAVRNLWYLERGGVPLERLAAELDRAGSKSPDDDRVRLGKARAALLAGKTRESKLWINSCLNKSRDDQPVARALLDWARIAGDGRAAIDAISRLRDRSGALDKPLIRSTRAWLRQLTGEVDAERSALRSLLVIEPNNAPALDRLAALDAKSAPADAKKLRERKAEVDRALDSYAQKITIAANYNSITSYIDMARTAESAGLMIDALGWASVALNADRDHAEAKRIAERTSAAIALDPADPTDSWESLRSEFGSIAAGSNLVQTGAKPNDRSTDSRSAPRPGDDSKRESSRDSRSAEKNILIQNDYDPSSNAESNRFVDGIAFEDLAAKSGLKFTYDNGESSVKHMPEMNGGGVALLDYDGDGLLDVYFTQGGSFPPDRKKSHHGDRLYRAGRDGTFKDVTKQSHLDDFPEGYAQGVAVGDYDGDGDPDLFTARWGSYALYRNEGNGTFADVTDAAGLGGFRDWPTSAAWADLDRDGDLDLYVCHYLKWDPAHPLVCPRDDGKPVHCGPRNLESLPDHVFKNENGKFIDMTESSGIVDKDGRGLGVIATDFDRDGEIDLFVSNDGTANFLFHNLGDWRFEEVGHTAGVAANALGGYQAGMGIARGDLDGDGELDLIVTNFYGESTSFFQGIGSGLFTDRTGAIGLRAHTRGLLGFGVKMCDINNDGIADLITANGHVNELIGIPYQMPVQLLIGTGGGRSIDATNLAGPALSRPRLGRALAAGDLDDDGRIDAVVLFLNTPAAYLHNISKNENRFVSIKLEGTKSNRDAIGARVTLYAGKIVRTAERYGGAGFHAAEDLRLHFGLGQEKQVDRVEIAWPSGLVETIGPLEVDAFYHVREGEAKARLIRKIAAKR